MSTPERTDMGSWRKPRSSENLEPLSLGDLVTPDTWETLRALANTARVTDDARKVAREAVVRCELRLEHESVSRKPDVVAAAAAFRTGIAPPNETRPAGEWSPVEISRALTGLKSELAAAERDHEQALGNYRTAINAAVSEAERACDAAEAEAAKQYASYWTVRYSATTFRAMLGTPAPAYTLPRIPGVSDSNLPRLNGASHDTSHGRVIFLGEQALSEDAPGKALKRFSQMVEERCGLWPSWKR